jgi:cob(I)alamin adenosyltransferase
MSSEWKIYTKRGDKGETSLIGGTRVPKYHQRIEAYGTVDELNSFIGLIADHIRDQETIKKLIYIQERLFITESLLAQDPDAEMRKLPQLSEGDVEFLEKEIDAMNEVLPELTSFILPGGHPAVSYSHVARCVCRRAERIALRLSTESPVDPLIIKYLNRLSDYFFVLARKFTFDFNVNEIKWLPQY